MNNAHLGPAQVLRKALLAQVLGECLAGLLCHLLHGVEAIQFGLRRRQAGHVGDIAGEVCCRLAPAEPGQCGDVPVLTLIAAVGRAPTSDFAAAFATVAEADAVRPFMPANHAR
ncbi:hypothetical protein D3C80_1489450 [compost metagenome]